MPRSSARTAVFVSYSHKDAIWLEHLRPHLNALARDRGFDSVFWDDTKIGAGSDWRTEIDAALLRAKVAILLVSKYFLDSEFITSNELPPLLTAAAADQATILPVIVGPSRFAHHPILSAFQTVNPPSKPLSGMRKVNYEWVFVKVSELVDAAIPRAGAGQGARGASSELPRAPHSKASASAVVTKSSMPASTVEAPPPSTRRRSDSRWMRAVIQVLPDGDIQYQFIRNGVRFDSRLRAPQRRLLDQIASQCRDSLTFDPHLAGSLFELLLPNDIKPHLFHGDGTILILDSTTARYPWEMLYDNSSGQLEPVTLHCPVIRQTVSDRFTPHPLSSRNNALVIGEPNVEDDRFPALPGARAEATYMADFLRTVGFVVNAQINTSATEVTSALFSRSYRLMHLSGNGVLNYVHSEGEPPVTGFLIGKDMFFTAAEVAQMRVAPELVFLNGCYLGRHVPASEEERSGRPERFAASLLDQFAMIGSRGIVAPVGPVDDLAAHTFATTFYAEIFAGETLGTALHIARRRTYYRNGTTNTWASYLCYGDPDYRLVPATRSPTESARARRQRWSPMPQPVFRTR